MYIRLIALAFVVVLWACSGGEKEGETAITPSTTSTDRRESASTLPVEATIGNLSLPESVLYDPEQDVYFISNVQGGVTEKDNNGFIAKVNAETLAVELKWIAGGNQGVTLHAPKGMTILGDLLYVSDIDVVRKFDRRSGAPQGEILLVGASFANDVVSDGKVVYVSDSGLGTSTGTDFSAQVTDAVWRISGDEAVKIASGADLGHPNGLDISGGKLYVLTFGANELYTLSEGKKEVVTTLVRGELDGITHDGETFYISSWAGDAVYRGPLRGPFEVVVQGVDTPADIGFDSKRDRLLLPKMMANEVTIHRAR